MPDLTLDGWTFLIAAVCAPLKWITTWNIDINASIVAVLNGSTIMPFFVLISGVFNENLFPIGDSSKYTMALAGFVGLIFVIGEAVSFQEMKKRFTKKKTDLQ